MSPTRDTPTQAQAVRILLADDSPDNILLIQAYLQSSGYSADVACNGTVALEMVISGHYDVVLMDVQMPVMDGYSATRKIREWESENHLAPIPILALTAHALPEDLRKSIAAGCTAHLTKPIRRATLIDAIEEHALGPARIDPGVLALIPGYLLSRRHDVSAVATAVEQSDYEKVRVLGHNMKGSGTGYGFSRISEIGASLEQAAVHRTLEEIRTLAGELAEYLDGLDLPATV